MAWYPGATKMELQPESDAQQAIRPTQLIVHSIVGPWTARRTYEYWRDSTNLESHFGLGYAGDIAQYIGTETRADANYRANRRPDGTGAISIETASNTKATDAWTPQQVEELIQLGVWTHQRHGIPLRICRSADDPGFGYHRLHSAWAAGGGTACPGPARIKQFRDVVFPAIVARATGKTTPDQSEEDDMAISDSDAEKIAKKVLTVDGVIVNPVKDSPNTHIALMTAVRNIEIVTRRSEAALAAQQAAIGELAKAVAAQDAAVDVDALIARIEAAIERVTVRLDVPDTTA